MKKIVLFIIMIFVVSSYSIDPFTYYWTIKLTGDTATVVKWKYNNDSVVNWAGRACDTIDAHKLLIDSALTKYTLWSLFSNHDSTFKWMNIDTIKGPVKIDTVIVGRADIDTITGLVVVDTSHIDLVSSQVDSTPYLKMHSDNGGSQVIEMMERTAGTGAVWGGSTGWGFQWKHDGSANKLLLLQNLYSATIDTLIEYLRDDPIIKINKTIQAHGFTTNGEDSITYNDTTVTLGVYDDSSSLGTIAGCRFVRVGSKVSLFLPTVGAVTAGGNTLLLKPVPSGFSVGADCERVVRGYFNSAKSFMSAKVFSAAPDYIIFAQEDDSDITAGSTYVYACCIEWTVD